MRNKGYDFPLYSLDLCGPFATPPDEPRFALPVREGLLVVAAALRRRAADLGTDACDLWLLRALACHEANLPALLPFGFSLAWAESMRHWARRMWQFEEERMLGQGSLDLLFADRRAHHERLRDVWRRLRLSQQLLGLGQALVPAALPKGTTALVDRLRLAAERLGDPALCDRLAEVGFGAAWREQLSRLLAAIDASHPRERALARARGLASDRLLVVRAALLGDLLRFGRAAKEALPAGVFIARTGSCDTHSG